MTNDIIRRISWRDVFPWLILFRTFRIAISPSLLAIATLAVIVTPLGWRFADLVFQPYRIAAEPVAPEIPRAWRKRIPRDENSRLKEELPLAASGYLPRVPTALLEAYFDLAEPLRRFFQLRMTIRETAYYAFGFLWMLAIWSFPGGLVTRRAVVQLATEAPSGTLATAAYAGRRILWYFLAPLAPLILLFLLAAPIAALGLIVRGLPAVGIPLAGLVWLLIAIAGLGALWLFGGLIFGWPLMWPTISAERDGDPFEAFSRSYSYVYGKPLHYFFYVVIAAAFGALCWAVVQVAAYLVQEFGFWALACGAGGANVEPIRAAAIAFATTGRTATAQADPLTIGTTLIGIVVWLIQAVVLAFRYTYFFAAAAAIYLLLRQDVDDKEMDEIYLDAEPAAGTMPTPAPPPT